jgi:hypothetical protein
VEPRLVDFEDALRTHTAVDDGHVDDVSLLKLACLLVTYCI